MDGTLRPGGHPDGITPAHHRLAGLLDRWPDETGPLVSDRRAPVVTSRHSADEPSERGSAADDAPIDTPWPAGGYEPAPGRHPSAPLPPRPPGVWDRLHRREDAPGAPAAGPDDDATVAHPLPAHPPTVARPYPAVPRADEHHDDADDADAGDDATGAHPVDWQDRTGGLEVIGDHDLNHDDLHPDDLHPDDLHPDDAYDEDEKPRRKRRRPVALVIALLLLVGVVAGIFVGGQKLLDVLNPTAEDFTGQGTGSVEVRVADGDTLSDIARTLVDAGVIASVDPFVDAAEANTASTGIQPGVYAMRDEMSGQAALDLMLDPVTKMVSKVTVPEGLTVAATLQRISDETGVPLADLEAAASDPAALGLPAYADGQLEGYLFPATYDFEPDTAPVEMLRQMVAQFTGVAADLQLEEQAAALGRTPGEIVTIASMIQSETLLDEERDKVAQVIYNRLDQDMRLGIDATLAYGLGKNGNELTVTDLQTDSPFNTRTRSGLPPTPISAPGEASLAAALQPSSGDLLYYVLASADGTHFFTSDPTEFEAARQRCAAAGLGCGG